MRLYLFLLASLLFAATIIHAEDEIDINDDEVEEPTTTRRTRMTSKRPSKTTTERPADESAVDEDYPKCHVGTINGHSGYLCERVVDGETKEFAFFSLGNGLFHCGEVANGKLNGAGYVVSYLLEDESKHWCGQFTDGDVNGSGQYAHFGYNFISMGGFKSGAPDGILVEYQTDKGILARSWYKEGKCRSKIRYNAFGEEFGRNAYSCSNN